ncbi:transposase [Thalassotalea sp. HSM 43]|uniref:transposase n=1 Tax=Thalassotalea sp. HSM 43 TaxID=2552945 RepID=UPI001080FB40|nr:transposase [Thalassotalea sp. HSM 43]QBY04337.1 transposase [Thalassotalea sp. HSM 43]
MPRSNRLCIADIPLHVIQRGNNRSNCFVEAKDYQYYLKLVGQYGKEFEVDIHAYVLMTNHVHLLLTPRKNGAVSLFMQAIGRKYVRYFNKKYERTGTLWEGRFRSCIIETGLYFLTVSRYIELNPVRAFMVESPGDYIWSSFAVNALGQKSDFIEFHSCYLAIANSDAKRQQLYLALFADELRDNVLETLRDSINRATVYGSDSYKRQLKDELKIKISVNCHGGDRRSHRFNRSDPLKKEQGPESPFK